MKLNKRFLALTLCALLSLAFAAGCNQELSVMDGALISSGTSDLISDTGVLYLKVNPEIAVHYDADGIVTSIVGINDDGKEIVKNSVDFAGMTCKDAVHALLLEINDAGYFAEEIEGRNRQIVIEIERGSVMPDDNFLGEIVADVKNYADNMNINSYIDLEGESDYSDQTVNRYDDTDYGPNSDGVTDYGYTNYDDTDYGPNSDGVTDYS